MAECTKVDAVEGDGGYKGGRRESERVDALEGERR